MINIKIMATEITEYEGKPVISLGSETKYPFRFGYSKAKLVLKYLKEIEAFVDKCEEALPGKKEK